MMNVLKNPKAALVKKRHAMRTTFGDYRQKMLEEEKTFASGELSFEYVNYLCCLIYSLALFISLFSSF